jgi:hypothetical protein
VAINSLGGELDLERNQPKVAPAVPGSRRIAMDENIDEKIEMHTTKIDYKNHVIWLSSYEMKTGGWIPRALVVLPAEEGNGQQELIYPGEATFPVWEEADKHAFEMGKQWIDTDLKITNVVSALGLLRDSAGSHGSLDAPAV